VISLKKLAELLVIVYGRGAYQEQTFPADRKRIDIGDYYADDSLIRNTLGWVPKVPLEEALKRIVDYYQTYSKHYWEDEVVDS
jgi:UDP-glucose 4-epimerase